MGSAISLGSSLLLLPVYATQFSPGQFGVVATGQVIGLAAITFARLGLNSGMFRFLAVYEADGDVQGADRAVTSSVAAAVLSSLAVTLLMLAAWAVVGSSAPSDVRLSGNLIAANVVLSAPTDMALFALRAKQHSMSYVALSSASVILTTLLTAGSVLLLHGGVVAVFASTAVASVVTSLAGLISIRNHLKWATFSIQELRRSLRFGLPSVPALLADWVMQFSDRLFLTRFASLAQVGVYSIGYRIGLIEQQILGTATSAAWDPFVLSEYREPEGSRTIGRVATYFAIIGMALVVFISASAPVLLFVIHARPAYFAATSVVFLIAFANLFAAMQHLFSAPTSIRVRPELGTLFRGLGAVVNIGLNFALIPQFGMLGAAWSTVATFVFTAAVTEVVSRRLWRIAYEYRKLLLILVGGLATQVCIQLAQSSGVLVLTGSSPLWSELLFAGWLLGTGTFSIDEVRALSRRLRHAVAT